MSRLTVRDFVSDDYEGLVALLNSVHSDNPVTLTELQDYDARRDPEKVFKRYVALRDAQLVGVAELRHGHTLFHPKKFNLDIAVHPAHRQQGIGSQLYDRLLAGVQRYQPIMFRMATQENRPAALGFIQRRGFVEEERTWESHLDTRDFDANPYAGLAEKMQSRGIEIRSLDSLMQLPDIRRRIYDLETELIMDAPWPEPPQPHSFEHFERNFFENINLMPQANLFALKDSELVGVSSLWDAQAGDALYTGLTGVRKAYRRQGIALALKVTNLAWAKANGHQLVKTWNDTLNRPMLAINEALGFHKQPAHIGFKKLLGDDNAPAA